ncbi:hypothetical protein INT44_005198 [Umbelopsis vinacea]|uniref:PDZ domain-containing protein n=1 Tax=Umbelopsis vinacea TaxID=44442 RepID=A0A8H7UQR8_9FUNG|nr:hypothetical protein INT44_005198 [Umbelopsis vinacea]
MQPESSSGQSTPETLDNMGNSSNSVPPVKRRRLSTSWNQPGKKPIDHSQTTTEQDEDADMPDAAMNGTNSISAMQPPQWQETIEKAVQSIVSIRASQVAAFDTEPAESSEASGFVVDAERGIILTNRHVACAGPFVGEAIFHDHEEVDVFPIYRDPVHDFGFLKFDPKKVKYMKVKQIALKPEGAKVGIDIRVVGNDAGEKLSILAGSISRLDRNCPDYGDLTYNDFNTFYLQAASSTSGGSSGSPVINIDGDAVGLQAGGHTKAATDYFLPLDRVKRALEYIRKGLDVPRGDIQAHFMYRPFDEVLRLGLQTSTEAKIRKLFPEEIGMLVAETIIPKGPAAEHMEEGDVLLTINGEYITKFGPFESVLDSNVDQEVAIGIERGGEYKEFTVRVGNLHAITPDRFVEIGGAKLNSLSYQLARAYCVPCQGVYVCEPHGMFRLDGPDQGWLIQSVDDKETPNLDAFVEVMKSIPDRERVPVVYHSIADFHTTLVAVVQVERHWAPFRMAVRNDKTGLWDYTDFGKPIPPKPIEPTTAKFITMNESLGPAKELIRCLVKISYYMPCRLDGFPKSRKFGAGLIVDKEKGLIVVSRSVVPTLLGDLTITFADSVIIPGKVEYLHPTHNFAIVRYDPKHIGDTNVLEAPFSDNVLGQGHKVTLVAYNHNQRPICLTTAVTDVTCITIPHNASPRFRGINMDSITLDTPLAQQCSSGLLADAEGKVQGLWLSYLGERNMNGHDSEYHLGLDIRSIVPCLRPLQQGVKPKLRSLNIELMPVQIAQAVSMGLSNEWISKVEKSNNTKHQLFLVRRMEAGSASAQVLKELDLVLAINDETITRMSQLDVQYNLEVLKMTILRHKKELVLDVPTSEIDEDGGATKRVVFWAGSALHEPHKAVLQQSKSVPSKIYVSARAKGSPAYQYGLVPTTWITHVNSKPTSDLDAFLEAVGQVQDNTYVRIRTVSFDNVPIVVSVKTNNHYFPTSDLRRDDASECGWARHEIS